MFENLHSWVLFTWVQAQNSINLINGLGRVASGPSNELVTYETPEDLQDLGA